MEIKPVVDPRVPFGVAVKHFRNEESLSQESLAEKCGLDRTYISGIERGKRNPSLVNIFRIANSLGVEASKLIELAENNTKEVL